jgi:ParB-like chromosome segregation protein Spo0J
MDAAPPAWPLSRIVEYARRPRHNYAGVDRICTWIRELGFKVACLVRSDREMVDGPPRLKAARRLGLREEVTGHAARRLQ